MTERFHPPLRVGQRFRLHPDCGTGDTVFVVLRVSACSALVRSLSSRHIVIEGDTPNEPKADFWKGSTPKPISLRSSVILLPQPDGQLPPNADEPQESSVQPGELCPSQVAEETDE